MPNRLIRDGLLESEAVLSLPVEARWLYVSILLSADDVGLFDATPFRLARRADVRREMADKLVQMLSDVDLIRLYEVDGKRYGFIPKYGQRLQLRRHKHPVPPMALLQGDSDAIKKINDLGSKSTVNNGESRMGNRSSPPESESESESEAKEEKSSPPVLADSAPRKRSADRGSRLASEWVLPKSWGEWAVSELGMGPEAVRLEASKFKDYWTAKTGRDATKADWQATWRNWCRNAGQKTSRPVSESFRERDARLAAERVAQATGGLSVARREAPKPLPFEEGFVVEVQDAKRIA